MLRTLLFIIFLGWAFPGARVEAQSLGELAAQEKARRAEKAKKAKAPRVYTEEDLQQHGGARPGPESAGPPPAVVASQAPAPEGSPEGESTEGGREKNEGPEEEWRQRHQQALAQVEGANQNLGAAQGEVERLKQDLNPMSTTFSTDPYKTLELQAKLTEAEKRVADAQKQVAAAQETADKVLNEAKQNGVYLR